MKSMQTSEQVKELLSQGHKLLLAGSEKALQGLPKGDWIAGTIPYFFTDQGGVKTHEMIQVTILPPEVLKIKINQYSEENVYTIPRNYFENGFSFIIIPAYSKVHYTFARDCSSWNGIFNQPLVGWIAGVDLQSETKVKAKVLNGMTGGSFEDRAVVMHLELNENFGVKANIINMFEQGDGDTLMFPETGFGIKKCKVNGVETNFSDYLIQKQANMQLPLVANYMGAMVNVSLKENDTANNYVHLYAPVFPGVEYRFAKEIVDYEEEFRKKTSDISVKPLFACNCILNYLYANLEGKKGGAFSSPMTFGEIGYMLLNQTLVHIDLIKKN